MNGPRQEKRELTIEEVKARRLKHRVLCTIAARYQEWAGAILATRWATDGFLDPSACLDMEEEAASFQARAQALWAEASKYTEPRCPVHGAPEVGGEAGGYECGCPYE
jgi:hypothetical protein